MTRNGSAAGALQTKTRLRAQTAADARRAAQGHRRCRGAHGDPPSARDHDGHPQSIRAIQVLRADRIVGLTGSHGRGAGSPVGEGGDNVWEGEEVVGDVGDGSGGWDGSRAGPPRRATGNVVCLVSRACLDVQTAVHNIRGAPSWAGVVVRRTLLSLQELVDGRILGDRFVCSVRVEVETKSRTERFPLQEDARSRGGNEKEDGGEKPGGRRRVHPDGEVSLERPLSAVMRGTYVLN